MKADIRGKDYRRQATESLHALLPQGEATPLCRGVFPAQVTDFMTRISNPHAAHVQPTQVPDSNVAPPRLTSEPGAPIQPDIEGTRAHGDRELAAQYGAALRGATGVTARDADQKIWPIPAHSTFGQWWAQLANALRSPDVAQWIHDKGINSHSISLNPASGRIHFTLKRYLDPAQTLHTLGLDDRDWGAISGPVLQAARVIAAGQADATFTLPGATNEHIAPLALVGNFYKEPPHLSGSALTQRADVLSRERRFARLDPVVFSDVVESRSEGALQSQKSVVDDTHAQHQAAASLRYLSAQLKDGTRSNADIADELQQNTIQLGTHSTYRSDHTQAWAEVSLKRFLEDNGWDVPTSREAMDNLAQAITTPPPNTPTHGNLGGALSWPQPLDQRNQRLLSSGLYAGSFGDIDVRPFNNVLEYLLDNRPLTPSALSQPRRLLDELLNTPRGKALGEAIQASFEARSIKGSATDWLLAALNVERVSLTDPFGAARPDTPLSIEGYTLFCAENAGKSASTIISEMEDHLVTTGRASSPATACVLTHLLLASRAPALLVKDIPDQVAVGTHSWVSFATAVARIEAKSPGATAAMGYARVMLEGSIAPVTDDERRIEYAAQHEAIKDWAVGNGLHYPTTDAAMALVRQRFSAQVNELREAAQTQIGEMPTTKALALAQLKLALPAMDPNLFEEKCITSQPASRHFPGPYSLLDLFIDGRALLGAPDSSDDWGRAGRAAANAVTLGNVTLPTDGAPGAWVASSHAININAALATLKDLPRPQDAFDEAFGAYASRVKKTTTAQLKHLIAKLPLEDRQNLEFGKISVRKEIEYSRDDRRVAEGVLLVETQRNGKAMTYAVDRLKGTVTQRPGQTYKAYPPAGGWYPSPGKRYDAVKPAGEYSSALLDERKGAHTVPDSFASDRTRYMADALIEDINLPAVHRSARGVTTFDTEVPTYKVVEDVALNLIPFRSAIKHFIDGNAKDGIVDLAFDIFGFAVGLGAAAKGAKGAFAGASAISRLGQTFKIVGRAAVGSLNPLSGVDDLARGVANGVRSLAGASYKGLKHLRGSYRSVNLLELAKKPDIAQGTFRASHRAQSTPALATFDEATQQWYAVNPRTQQAYGKPLENFVVDSPNSNDASSLHALGGDDLVKIADRQQGLAANGTFKVGQHTVEGHAVLFQGHWHQYDAVKKYPFGPPLKDFTPKRLAASGETRTLDANLRGYEARHIAPHALSTKGLQGNVYVGRSKKEYVKVDGTLYESRLKDGQRIIRHPNGTGPDIAIRDLGVSGWEPTSRSARLLGGAHDTPTPWKFGDSTYVVPMDDIDVVEHAATPFRLNHKGAEHSVIFDSSAGAWKLTPLATGIDDTPAKYFWRSAKGKWQRGTLDEFSKAKKADAHQYTFIDVSPPSVLKLPNEVKPLPKALHYFWAGQEIPSHLADNIARNATQAPGYTSILHVDADSPAVFQRIKNTLESKVPGVKIVNLHEDEVFKQLRRGEMYDYFRQGQGKNLAAASDVARYPIMNKHGGVYLDTDDVIQKNIGTDALLAGADDVLLGAPVVHSLTDYTPFYNTSNFATRPGNPVIEAMITQMKQRFKANKAYFAANRPTATKSANGRVHYTPEFSAYERKIFETAGPNLFNDILKSKRPDLYDLGLDGLAKESKLVDGSLVSSGPIVDIENDVLGVYASKGLAPPDHLREQIQKIKHHYYPLRYRFNIRIGADHSWINT